MNSVTRLKALRLHQEITFGLDGNDAPFLGEGWADAEFGRRFLRGPVGEIRMIHPGNTDLLLELDTVTIAGAPGTASPHIEVELNGRLAATITLPGQARRAAHIPAALVPPGQILALRLRQAASALPADGQAGTPGVAFNRLCLFTLRGQAASTPGISGSASAGPYADRGGVALETSPAFFEGFGDTGEFAAVQRKAGVSTSGLQLSTFAVPQGLLRALDASFAGLGDAETFDVKLYPQNPLDYIVLDKTYGAEFRSQHEATEIRLAEFIEQQGARLRAARRALLRTMQAGEKIFVVYRGAPGPALTEQEVLPLLIALNRHGPNYLLWVAPADAAHKPGTVRQTVPFLLRGAIDRFQTGQDARTVAFDTWLLLCRNALDIAFPAGSVGAATIDPAGPAAPEPRQQSSATQIQPAPDIAPANVWMSGPASNAAPAAPAASATQEVTRAGRPDDYALLQGWRFGETGNEEAVLGFGWSGPEEGFRWTDGTACELWLDHPGKRDVFVVVEAWPFVMPPEIPVQRALFSAHDAPLGTLAFTETSRLALPVAASALRPGRVMRLRCELPDATKPSDTNLDSEDSRQLGLGFMRVSVHAAVPRAHRIQTGGGGLSIEEAEQRTGLPAAEFLARFEPLGETQDLANLQGELGQEPPGLFHRASLPLVDLMRVLDSRLEGVGDPAKLQAELIGGDPELYEIRDETTGLTFVTERAKGDASPDMLAARQARRLKFLRDQLLHDLSAGEKIFVYHRSMQETPLAEPNMLALLISLRQHGPATLLFLTRADGPHPPGTVAQLYPGLLQGYLTDDDDSAVWLEVLANAHVMSKAGSKAVLF